MSDPALEWQIGFDAGGSKTAMLAAASSREPVRLTGPAAHLQHTDADRVGRVFADLITELLQQAPGSRIVSICAGVAGAGRAEGQRAITDALRRALGERAPSADRIQIVHDGIIALEAAFEGQSGIITIIGTGSLVLARSASGDVLRAGGWGPLLGDNGSGLSLGRRAMRAVAAALDGGPPTQLQTMVEEAYQVHTIDDLISTVYQPDWPMQQVAPLLIDAADAGDEAARSILHRETLLLARQVQWLADRCSDTRKQIAPMGGLAGEALYRSALADAIDKTLPDWQIRDAMNPPVMGALRMAQKLAGVPPATS